MRRYIAWIIFYVSLTSVSIGQQDWITYGCYGPGPGPQLPLVSFGERLPDLYYWDTNWYDYKWAQYGPFIMEKQFPIMGPKYVGRPCVTDTPLKVIGIAAPIWIVKFAAPVDTTLEGRLPEFFQLYQKEGNNYLKKAETRWDTVTPQYWMELGCDAPSPLLYSYDTGRLYKAYFDKPVLVHDTFFVGGTTWNNCPLGQNPDFPNLDKDLQFHLNTLYAAYVYAVYYDLPDFPNYPNPKGYLRKWLKPSIYYYSTPTLGGSVDTNATWILPPENGVGDADKHSWYGFFAIIDTDFVYEACSVPTGLQLLGVHDLAATVTWDAGTDTMWEVSLTLAGDSPDEGLVVETTDNYYYFDSLDTSVVYEIRVRALCDGEVYGLWSAPLQFLSYCSVPTNLHVVSTNVGKVVLQWTAGSDAESWQVEVAPQGTPLGNGTIVSASMYFTPCNGLDTATWHWARVRTVCGENQVSNWTDTVMFYVPGDGSGTDTNGSDTTTVIDLVEMYTYLMPNPAKEEVTVMSSFRVKKVELFAADGKLLQAQEVNSAGTRLSLEGLPAGVYFVRVTTSAGVTTKRLVVE